MELQLMDEMRHVAVRFLPFSVLIYRVICHLPANKKQFVDKTPNYYFQIIQLFDIYSTFFNITDYVS